MGGDLCYDVNFDEIKDSLLKRSCNNIVEDVESFIISPEDQTVPTDVQTVEGERLLADETVSLHSVLNSLVAEPGRTGAERQLRGVSEKA